MANKKDYSKIEFMYCKEEPCSCKFKKVKDEKYEFNQDYYVTECGKVFSSKYNGKERYVLKQYPHNSGNIKRYMVVLKTTTGKNKDFAVDKLVYHMFHEGIYKRDKGWYVHHLDGDPRNNRLENLVYRNHRPRYDHIKATEIEFMYCKEEPCDCKVRPTGFEGYSVSECGKVYGMNGKLMKQSLNSNYLAVSIRLPKGHKTTQRVHRLVAEAFIPNPGNLPHINHKDHNPFNNHRDNLEWVTNTENSIYGIITNNSKVERMKAIIQDIIDRVPKEDIMKKYGLSIRTVERVMAKQVYRPIWEIYFKEHMNIDYRQLKYNVKKR